MRGKWIYCEDGSRLYIGPFWMGTPKQISDTQEEIDNDCDLYEEAEQQDDFEWFGNEYARR